MLAGYYIIIISFSANWRFGWCRLFKILNDRLDIVIKIWEFDLFYWRQRMQYDIISSISLIEKFKELIVDWENNEKSKQLLFCSNFVALYHWFCR